MTDDSDAARRGGGPPREDADATAQVVHHTTAAEAAEIVVPHQSAGAEDSGRSSDATTQHAQPEGAPQGYKPGETPSDAAPQPPTGPVYEAAPTIAPASIPTSAAPRYDAQYEGDPYPTPPAYGPARADASNQHYSYGPFQGGDQQYDAYPSSGAWSTGPAPGGDPAQGAGSTPGTGLTSGAGFTPGAGPTSGAGPPHNVDPGYGPDQMRGAGPTYGANLASGAEPMASGAESMAYGADPIYRPAPPAGAGPTPAQPSWSNTDPLSATGAPADHYGFDIAPPFGGGGPRIEPTPKQPRGRFILPALAGLLIGLLLFGTGGWFLGRATADDPNPTATTAQTGPSTAPPNTAPTGAYEQNQIAINRPKLSGTLATVSQGWLPYLSGCSRSGDKGGPTLNQGEKTRVRCEMDAMSVIFVEYRSTADRDKARVATLSQNDDARKLAPGVGAAVERPTPSGRTSGNYVEYAYQAAGRTVSAIWWDDADTPVAAYLLAFWKEGAGEKWEPMRDVWARYA